MEWGCDPKFLNMILRRSPSLARMAGPGTRLLKVHAGKWMPGAISISLSTASISKVRSVRPSGKIDTVPVYQSVNMAEGSKPLAAWSTTPTVIMLPWAMPAMGEA